MRFLDPRTYGIPNIGQGLLWGFAIRHAAGEIRHDRDKTATILRRERFDKNRVVELCCRHRLSSRYSLDESHQLADIDRFDRPAARYRQNITLARMRHLVMRAAAGRW